jgi:hypothetical protein
MLPAFRQTCAMHNNINLHAMLTLAKADLGKCASRRPSTKTISELS